MTDRDKRALVALAVAVPVALAVYLWPESREAVPVVGMYQSIPEAERRLEQLRKRVAYLPPRENAAAKVAAVLAEREKGLIRGETPAQSQAALLQVVRRACEAQTPAVEIRGSSFGEVRPAGDYYGQVSVTVNFNARIEQLVNLLAELSAQPEYTEVDRLVLGQAHEKQKIIPVQMVVVGLVPRSMVPEPNKKGGIAF